MLKSRVLMLGIGQAGSNVVKEFENLGYNVFYVNTSYEDLKPLDTDDSKIYHISGAKGCGRDRDKAIAYAVDYYEDIINEIEAKYPTCDLVYVAYSVGGGTGSGIAPTLLDIISSKNPNKYYGAIPILPHKTESILTHSNARESLKQLIDIQDKLYGIHLLDNNKREDFLEINREFSVLLDTFIDFNETTQKGNIDGEDFEKLATDSGVTVILEFESEDFKVGLAKAINDSIYADWNSDCNLLGVILEEGKNKSQCLEEIYETFGIPITDYSTYTKGSNLIVATGLSFNTGIAKRLALTANEKLRKKQELEIEKSNKDEEIDDVALDLKSLTSKKTPVNKKKGKDNNNVTKELNSILDKYRRM